MAIFPMDDPAYASTFAAEAAMVDAAELLARALESSVISQADLARALGVSRSEITARFQGERNMTIRTLAKTLHALGQELTLHCAPAAFEQEESSAYREWKKPELPDEVKHAGTSTTRRWTTSKYAEVT